jgi:tRNA(Arg) A34 adenosine deaminase TadA
MCREALKQARVGQIIFGAFAKKGEDSSPQIARPSKPLLGGILESENQARLEAYFQSKR